MLKEKNRDVRINFINVNKYLLYVYSKISMEQEKKGKNQNL